MLVYQRVDQIPNRTYMLVYPRACFKIQVEVGLVDPPIGDNCYMKSGWMVGQMSAEMDGNMISLRMDMYILYVYIRLLYIYIYI